jgi:hypothetical protein
VNPTVCRYSAYPIRRSSFGSVSRMDCGCGTEPAFFERL